MAHSKNDVPFCGGTLRCYCRKVQGHYDAVRQLIDLETTCPHTNQSLYDALMRRKGERPALAPAIEHEIAEIAQKANSDPNAPFQLRCSAASPEAAEKRAEKELMPRVKSIAKLLFRPQWEKLVAAGSPTVGCFVDYMGKDIFRDATSGDKTHLMSALRTVILPIIRDMRLDEMVTKQQQEQIKGKINHYLKKHGSESFGDYTKRAWRDLVRSITYCGFAGCRSALDLADAIEVTRRQNRSLPNSIRPGHLDPDQRAALFALLADKAHWHERLVVALIYCGLDLREISAMRYGDVEELILPRESCLTITVDKIVSGLDAGASVTNICSEDFAVKRLRRVVLYPWAAAMLLQYVHLLQQEKFSLSQIHKMRFSYSVSNRCLLTPRQMESAIEQSLRDAGIPDIPIPRSKDGGTVMIIEEPQFSLLRSDAQYVAGQCGANLPMIHAMFGTAWTEMDEMSYLDLLSDTYAVARYLRLKRFSPFESTVLQRRVLRAENSSDEPQDLTISSLFAINAKWKEKG